MWGLLWLTVDECEVEAVFSALLVLACSPKGEPPLARFTAVKDPVESAIAPGGLAAEDGPADNCRAETLGWNVASWAKPESGQEFTGLHEASPLIAKHLVLLYHQIVSMR